MRVLTAFAVIALCMLSGSAAADTAQSALGFHVPTYRNPADVPTPSLRASDSAYDFGLIHGAFDDSEAPQSPKKKSYLPVLYSFLIPGAGEMVLGYPYRGAALMAAEVVAWSGYYYYRDQGLQGREDYEAYADAHWSRDRFIQQHAATEDMINNAGYTPPVTLEELDAYGRTTWAGWPPYHTYHAKAEEKQNYYENLGKYDWFISGWDDWDLATKPTDTANRTHYRGMRNESNDNLDTADPFIILSITARVFSLVETYFLIRSHNRAVESGAGATVDDRRFAFRARSTGPASGELSLEFRFK
jgi:hypothetical protein